VIGCATNKDGRPETIEVFDLKVKLAAPMVCVGLFVAKLCAPTDGQSG
jgi:hypothetical protein